MPADGRWDLTWRLQGSQWLLHELPASTRKNS